MKMLATLAASTLIASGFVIGVAHSAPVSEFHRVTERVIELRNMGTPANMQEDIPYGSPGVTNDDFFIMGCDDSSAQRDHPDVAPWDLLKGYWFVAAKGFAIKNAGGNFESTTLPSGKEEVDSFLEGLPAPEYHASPEEVAWHYIRVKQLRKEGLLVEQRMAIMKAEAQTRPWEHMH